MWAAVSRARGLFRMFVRQAHTCFRGLRYRGFWPRTVVRQKMYDRTATAIFPVNYRVKRLYVLRTTVQKGATLSFRCGYASGSLRFLSEAWELVVSPLLAISDTPTRGNVGRRPAGPKSPSARRFLHPMGPPVGPPNQYHWDSQAKQVLKTI